MGKTSKPQSTISYNTDRFLKKTLNQLVSDGIVSYWFYIHHKADTDDRSDHIHLRIELRKPYDTIELQKLFIQNIRDKKHKTTKTRSFQYSDCNNWFMYVVHNVDYLRYKHMTRNYQYTLQEIKSNDKEECEYRYRIALEWLYSDLLRDLYAEDKLKKGISIQCLADSGIVTSRNAFRMRQFNELLSKSKIDKEYDNALKLQSEYLQALDVIHAKQDELNKAIAYYNHINKETRLINQQLTFKLDSNPFESEE